MKHIKIVNDRSDYPLHIGVTGAGTPSGQIKSAAGVGAFCCWRISETPCVFLQTADPVEEVLFAKELLAALGIRKDAIEIVPVQHAAGLKWIWKRSQKA